MSVFGDIFNGIKRVVLLDEHVAAMRTELTQLKHTVENDAQRLSRIEGILEIAMRPRRLDRD